MITVNRPFGSLEPLTTYIDTLQQVTEHPTPDNIAELQLLDKTLTDRAVLFPKYEYVHREGYRTVGFNPCTISDGVTGLAYVALYEPGSPEYYAEYSRRFHGNLQTVSTTPDLATGEKRRNHARGALMSLGGKLAVSGAFFGDEIEPAYEAIRGGIDKIGLHDKDFLGFGLMRISKDLLRESTYIARRQPYQVPISRNEAKENIKHAWNVVGHPGWLAKISAFVA